MAALSEFPRGELPRVEVGRTRLRPTTMVFGGAPIGGLYEPVDEVAAQATLEAAWASGIRAFDTAPHYGVGLSERRLGDFLEGRPRDEFVLSTKVGRVLVPTDEDVEGSEGFHGTPRFARVRDYSRDGVLSSLEASLARLQLDRVDIVLVHDPENHERQALEEAYPALEELRAAGVVGAIGFGMNYVAPLERFVRETDLDCILVAGRYSLLDSSARERLLPECARRGVSVLVAGVLGSGVLARPEPGSHYFYAPAPQAILDQVGRIAALCERHDVSLRAAALQFPLRHPAVSAIVVGARSAQEIEEDVRDFSTELPEALFDEIAALGEPA
jgi:D-threo-aldose 1-dehydrogenase